MFAKGAEQNFSTEIFRIPKVINRTPRPVYEREHLNRTPTDGQFYQQHLTPVRVTKRAVYKTDKILDKPDRRCTLEDPVRCKVYSRDVHSRIAASIVKNVGSPQTLYVTLHNNAIQNLYTDNTIGAFAVDLVQSIELGPIEKLMWGCVNSRILRLMKVRLNP